jgi:hypothetical protein
MTRRLAKKTQAVIDELNLSLGEVADKMYKLKLEKEEIENEYKLWDKWLKSHMKVGDSADGVRVRLTLTETERLEVAVQALKNAFPDTYEECLQVVISAAEKKYGREPLEKIGVMVPYQKKWDWQPKEI